MWVLFIFFSCIATRRRKKKRERKEKEESFLPPHFLVEFQLFGDPKSQLPLDAAALSLWSAPIPNRAVCHSMDWGQLLSRSPPAWPQCLDCPYYSCPTPQHHPDPAVLMAPMIEALSLVLL